MIDIDPRFGMSDRDVRIAMKASTVALKNRGRPVAAAGKQAANDDEAVRMETREMLERLIIKEREEARDEARLRQAANDERRLKQAEREEAERDDSERRRKALLMRMDSYEAAFNTTLRENLSALESTPRNGFRSCLMKLLRQYHSDKVEKMADPELLAKFPERMKKLFDEASKQLTSKLERR